MVHPLGPCAEAVRLADFVWPGPGCDRALHHRSGAPPVVCTSWCEPVGGATRRVLRQAEVTGDGLRALDETWFELDAAGFAEVARFRSRGGPNLHPRPIPSPAVLAVGQAHAPWPGQPFTVTAAWCGPVVLELGGRRAEVRAASLVAEEPRGRRVQWLVEGAGEVWLGPEGGAPERWLVGWRGAHRELLQPLGPLFDAPWPELPLHGHHPSTRGLFG